MASSSSCGLSRAQNKLQRTFLDETLTTPPYRKSGYQLNYQSQGAPLPNPPAACANAGFNAYLTTAMPIIVGQTGQATYGSEEPGVIQMAPAYKRLLTLFVTRWLLFSGPQWSSCKPGSDRERLGYGAREPSASASY
jgi:hypothetical protein